MRTVLIVDDDDRLRESMARDFRRRGVQARTAASQAQAAAALRAERADVALLDLLLEDGSGFDVLRDIRETSPHTRVVILTGFASIANAVEAGRLGAHDYLPKPITPAEILAVLDGKKPDPPPRVRLGQHPPSLAHNEREYIQRVLGECRGNISEAARALGINRRTLQRKLQKQS
ncbi:MAG TPA: response regulator [Polyangia bacterium]|nr:response regulator [Polyangia bacterium]